MQKTPAFRLLLRFTPNAHMPVAGPSAECPGVARLLDGNRYVVSSDPFD